MRKRRPRRVPVTKGLKDLYAMDMHLPYQAACAGKFSVTGFGRMAAALMIVRSALEQAHTKIPQAMETLDETLMMLQEIRRRGDSTEVWEITEAERPAILNGIQMAEQCIGTLTTAQLAQTADMLLQQVLGETPQ